MGWRSAALAAGLAAAVFAAAPASADRDEHDDERCVGGKALRLVNGRIHTMDRHDRVVSSVLIKNGRFAAVGRGARDWDDDCVREINLRGRTAVPGIIDNHNHIVLLGLRPGHDTRIESARSIQEVKDTLEARSRGIPAGEWLTALGGFNTSQFAELRMPTRQELDPATPQHPVLIMQGFSGPTVTNSLGRT
jgi:predicted amidohydrolase YtcJ